MQTAFQAEKPYNHAFGVRKMHPFCRLRRRPPPEGEILAALCLEVLLR